jgi:hypothetical protein
VAKLANRILLGWANEEQIEESADLEQAHDVTFYLAKGKLALPLFCGPVSKDQGAQTSAADIRYVLEIDDDTATALLDQGHQPIAELFRSRIVDSAVSLENCDIIRNCLDELHGDTPLDLSPLAKWDLRQSRVTPPQLQKSPSCASLAPARYPLDRRRPTMRLEFP